MCPCGACNDDSEHTPDQCGGKYHETREETDDD
jgi:hypothetical protein